MVNNGLELTPQERALLHVAICARDEEAAKSVLMDATRRQIEADSRTAIEEPERHISELEAWQHQDE